MVTHWERKNYVLGGGNANVALVALARQELPDPLPISRSKHGMPQADGALSVSLAVRSRATNPTWFDENIVMPFAGLIEQDLSAADAAAASSANFAYIVTSDIADPDDLTHIQAAWALAKCICEQGALVVIDVPAARAHRGEDIASLDPERGLDVMFEVAIFFDERGDNEVIAWTAGLQKFGRPNLVVPGINREFAAIAAEVLRDAAVSLAHGERLEIGDTLEVNDRMFIATELPADHGTSVDGAAVALIEKD